MFASTFMGANIGTYYESIISGSTFKESIFGGLYGGIGGAVFGYLSPVLVPVCLFGLPGYAIGKLTAHFSESGF